MNKQSIQKQILTWNLLALESTYALSSAMAECSQIPPPPPSAAAISLRDRYFSTLQKQKPSLIQHTVSLISNFTSLNKLAYLQSVNYVNHTDMHTFWTSILNQRSKNDEDHERQKNLKAILSTYSLLPFIGFAATMIFVFKFTGLYKLSWRKWALAAGLVWIGGTVFLRYRRSAQIFYSIPKLSDPELQQARLDIIDRSIVLDGKINLIGFSSGLVNELLEQADKEPDQAQKKLILEAAGYIVVDQADYKYDQL